jgi:hypothetical protein
MECLEGPHEDGENSRPAKPIGVGNRRVLFLLKSVIHLRNNDIYSATICRRVSSYICNVGVRVYGYLEFPVDCLLKAGLSSLCEAVTAGGLTAPSL